MNPMSRRGLLAVTAGGSLIGAATKVQAQSFGNPDLPPQGAINAKSASAVSPPCGWWEGALSSAT